MPTLSQQIYEEKKILKEKILASVLEFVDKTGIIIDSIDLISYVDSDDIKLNIHA